MATALADKTGTIEQGQQVDWRDIKFGVLVGCVFAVTKYIVLYRLEWHFNASEPLVCFFLTFAYILVRARRQPDKLDEWGITTPLSAPAILVACAFFGIGVLVLAINRIHIAGTLPFSMGMVTGSIEYISSGFTQQFFLCSVGLVSLGKMRIFRGWLRLPLALAACFGVMHLWMPLSAPAERFWIELAGVAGVAGLGFLASAYFLLFRNMIPIAIIHAVGFGISQDWMNGLQ